MKVYGIEYIFMKLGKATDKMINKFKSIWDEIKL